MHWVSMASCTDNETVATQFLQRGGTLITIENPMELYDMQPFSFKPWERELVAPPCSAFRSLETPSQPTEEDNMILRVRVEQIRRCGEERV
mmetsp:Transcript_9109/g.21297  ORF Transcript_9109/g.21297 Transcript_9109/m.21297 type:complete len:91 (-) Transcript_9109:80-352(-)